MVEKTRGSATSRPNTGCKSLSGCTPSSGCRLWRLFSRLCSREKRKNLENASSAELATLVRDMVGSRAGIVHASLPKDDPVRRNPDIALAQKLLGGWTPQVPLERGLEATSRISVG